MSPSVDVYRVVYHDTPPDWKRPPDRPRQIWLLTAIYGDLHTWHFTGQCSRLEQNWTLWRLVRGAKHQHAAWS